MGSLLEFVTFDHLLLILPDFCLWTTCPGHYRISNSVMQPSPMKTLECLGSCLIPLWKETSKRSERVPGVLSSGTLHSVWFLHSPMLLELIAVIFFNSAIEEEKIENKSFTEVMFYTDNKDNAYHQLVTE